MSIISINNYIKKSKERALNRLIFTRPFFSNMLYIFVFFCCLLVKRDDLLYNETFIVCTNSQFPHTHTHTRTQGRTHGRTTSMLLYWIPLQGSLL